MKVFFNKSYLTGKELVYIRESFQRGEFAGDSFYTHKCHHLIEKKFKVPKVFLTTSGTHALEMAYLLLNIGPGDEVIVPSFTFPSTANAFVLRGAKPIFVDIRRDTLNMDEKLITDKISRKTKVICPVHYAGVGCEMAEITKIAKKKKIFVVEDAALGVGAKYKNQYLGTIGDLGTYSFHESKNYTCGEGGALLINNPRFIERAEIIREKGTNRSRLLRREIKKYHWIDVGSSYLLSDILAAFLNAQISQMDEIQKKRKQIFNYYYKSLQSLEDQQFIRRPILAVDSSSNYSLFYIILSSERMREKVRIGLEKRGIEAYTHYEPLHLSPMGKKFGYKKGDLPVTEDLSQRLLRLPLYPGLSREEQDYVIENLYILLIKI